MDDTSCTQMTWEETARWGQPLYRSRQDKRASVTYLFRFDVAEHRDLFFDGVLQSGGAAAHDLSAKMTQTGDESRTTTWWRGGRGFCVEHTIEHEFRVNLTYKRAHGHNSQFKWFQPASDQKGRSCSDEPLNQLNETIYNTRLHFLTISQLIWYDMRFKEQNSEH